MLRLVADRDRGWTPRARLVLAACAALRCGRRRGPCILPLPLLALLLLVLLLAGCGAGAWTRPATGSDESDGGAAASRVSGCDLASAEEHLVLGALATRRAQAYYQSWQRAARPAYLRLSHAQQVQASGFLWRYQRRVGHSACGYYRLNRARRASCRSLNRIKSVALRFAVPLETGNITACYDLPFRG